MGRASLEAVDEKLKRGYKHFEAFTREATDFLRDPDSYSLALEQDEKRQPLLRVEDARVPPMRWSILIGEFVYQLHSALDHLAYQLALANTRGPLPKKVAEASAFPIFNSGPKYRAANRKGKPSPNSGRFKLQGVSRDAAAIIERLQPYHRRKKPAARALWQLYELSNVDKHRLLHVTHSSLQGSRFDLQWTGPVVIHGYQFFPGPLKRGAPIVRWNLEAPEGTTFGMHVNVELQTDITFGKSSAARSVRGQSVLVTLYNIGYFIGTEVLPPLSAELGLTSSFNPGRLLDLRNLPPDWGLKPGTQLENLAIQEIASAENDHV